MVQIKRFRGCPFLCSSAPPVGSSAGIRTACRRESADATQARLSDAQLATGQARWRTVQFAEHLRRKLEATRRDVRTVDWMEEVPTLIEDALTHIEGRFRAENAILANITTTRDDATDPHRKRQAADLVDIVRECLNRHTALQRRLQDAGASFRAEQDRQQFSGEVRQATVDLFGQLLAPTSVLHGVAARAGLCDRSTT